MDEDPNGSAVVVVWYVYSGQYQGRKSELQMEIGDAIGGP